MELAFWICTVWIGYVFVGYPLLSGVLAMILNRRVLTANDVPSVTVVIAAYNEADHIVETVQNKLDQDYPENKLDVVVVSDDSDDGTDELVQGFSIDRVTLIRQSPRQGKTAGLNLALPRIDSEIVIFSDANSQYSANAVRKLVRNFADDNVGYVTGKMVYASLRGNAVGDGCTSYMRLENWIRANETRMGSVVGVDGGIDAVRRVAYRPMNADQLPDFVLPLLVRKQGYRVIYEPEAQLVEDALDDGRAEFRMRVRVSLRAIWALKDMSELLNPFRYGLFALQLCSHKLLRYLAVLPLLVLPFISWSLLDHGTIYEYVFFGQILLYTLALTAMLTRTPSIIQSIPYYFTLVNVASGIALWQFLLGKKQVIWQPRQGG